MCIRDRGKAAGGAREVRDDNEHNAKGPEVAEREVRDGGSRRKTGLGRKSGRTPRNAGRDSGERARE
eukprot:8319886-Alexandrium_andersonii.AAC.1